MLVEAFLFSSIHEKPLCLIFSSGRRPLASGGIPQALVIIIMIMQAVQSDSLWRSITHLKVFNVNSKKYGILVN